MTPKQRIHLHSRLWPNAARTQGWNPNDRPRRLALINEILAHHPHPARRRLITSASQLDAHTDYTLVKTRLLMLADNLIAAHEDGDLTYNAARQRREIIRRLAKRLAEHFETSNPPGQHDSNAATRAEHYVLKIIRDTTVRAGYEPESFTHATFEQVLTALDLPALHRLTITLRARHRALTRK